MLIEQVETMLKEQAKAEVGKARDPFRASSAGHCTRKCAYDMLGVPGEPLTPRRQMVFMQGHLVELQMQDLLKRALGDKYIDGASLGDNHFEIDGIKISYHIDGAFQHSDGKIGIMECKSMSDYAFDRAVKGEIEETYLCQAWCYEQATDFNPVVFICYRKETSHICEVIFDRNCKERVVTVRLGGNVLELAKDDPLMVTEVRTPFDDSVGEKVRKHFAWLRIFANNPDYPTMPTGVNAIEDETVSVQGEIKAANFARDNNVLMVSAEKSGSWYKFKTGRKIAKFPCNYCNHIKTCLGAELEIKNSKPVWVVA